MGELTGGVQFILFQGIKSDSSRYIQSQDVCELNRNETLTPFFASLFYYYIGSAEGHEYPDLQVGDEVNPRPDFIFS